MQVRASNTGSDVDSVVAAIRLEIGIRQRVAQLKAVLSLASINARINDRSGQADRVVVLITEQLNVQSGCRCQIKTVCSVLPVKVVPAPKPALLN